MLLLSIRCLFSKAGGFARIQKHLCRIPWNIRCWDVCPWSFPLLGAVSPNPGSVLPFPELRVVKLSRPCTKLAFLISWLSVGAGVSVSRQWYMDERCGYPHPRTLSCPGSCRLSFTRSCGHSAPCLSYNALPSCLLAQAFFTCYRERGLEGEDSTISPCSTVLTHPD